MMNQMLVLNQLDDRSWEHQGTSGCSEWKSNQSFLTNWMMMDYIYVFWTVNFMIIPSYPTLLMVTPRFQPSVSTTKPICMKSCGWDNSDCSSKWLPNFEYGYNHSWASSKPGMCV